MKSNWLITVRRRPKNNIPEMENMFIICNTKHPNLNKLGLKPYEDVVRMIRLETPRITLSPAPRITLPPVL